LDATFPSFTSEACMAFATAAGYQAVTCPSEVATVGQVTVTGDTTKVAGTPGGAAVARGLPIIPGNLNVANRGKSVAFDVGEDGTLSLELFESYDDFADGDQSSNLTSDPPDATWRGTLTVLYHERLAVGHDYQDVESAYCTGIDCAVEDEHEVIFPVTLPGPALPTDDSIPSTSTAVPGDGRYYVGVYNSRTGSAGGTLSQHESARFVSSMTYTIRATTSTPDAAVCHRNCSGLGTCTPYRAPACDCDVGFFGVACSIAPTEMLLVSERDRKTAAGAAAATAAAEDRAEGPATPTKPSWATPTPSTSVPTTSSSASSARDGVLAASASGYISEGHYDYHYVVGREQREHHQATFIPPSTFSHDARNLLPQPLHVTRP
jgi:hypothetical protein